MSLETTKITQAKAYIQELLDKHKLNDWTINIDRRRSCIAETFYKPKTMHFSRYFILQTSKEQLEGITLHEIAHALLGPGFFHGQEFVDKCLEISPSDKYINQSVNIPIRKYLYTCPECGQSDSLNDIKDRYCGLCLLDKKSIKFDIKENEIKVNVW